MNKQEQNGFSTPMMKQYNLIKKQHPDCLLFFRLGDFYELFNEDAKIGAAVLNIALTRRPRGKDGDIPMAGVPFHAADTYIAKLVQAGYKIAICEQISEPNSRGIVDREVIRIVTPGTIMDESILEKKQHNYVMSLFVEQKFINIAFADISTGDFQATQIAYENNSRQMLLDELTRFAPTECILNEKSYYDKELRKSLSVQNRLSVFLYDEWEQYADDYETELKKHFQLNSTLGIDLAEKPGALQAAAALLGYLKHTQKNHIGHLHTLRIYHPSDYLVLDRATINNLELFSSLHANTKKGTLVSSIDRTITAMGGRLLRDWISKPLHKKIHIEKRQEGIGYFFNNHAISQKITPLLQNIQDMPRTVSRLTVSLGNTHDLLQLAKSLRYSLEIKTLIADASAPLIQTCREKIPDTLTETIRLIEQTIVPNAPIDLKGGGLIQDGINTRLDELRKIANNSKQLLAEMETAERKKSGINSLKIKFNKIFGYYIEISKANLHLTPKDYFRKQTMVNAERFITPELKAYEQTILSAQEEINTLEYTIFTQTVEKVLADSQHLQATARSIANIDCLNGLASLAKEFSYIKPTIALDGTLRIIQGRHPVVEQLQAHPFVPNDTLLDHKDHQLLVITGPNMAGKSVYMRQVALIVLLAHIGSYVPARQAFIPLVDRIFVRSGASDMITQGVSTFMMEMIETAHILNNATRQSLIIMDEIGRGTSTYDGISIAWSIAEYLVSNLALGAKTLFATHYHELQQLEEEFPHHIKNYTVLVEQKTDGEPIFMHTVVPGRASHSYAIAVAKLAGVPAAVTARANNILLSLERKNTDPAAITDQAASSKNNRPNHFHPLLKKIKTTDITKLTPLEALNLLAKIQQELQQ
jgi:DNA mismatch repair protein MutS